MPNSLSPKLRPLERAQSADHVKFNVPTPPMSACGHPNAGQELCYLCHQRGRRNIPVSFNEERKRREDEEDTLLKQFQQMKDAEETLDEQVCLTLRKLFSFRYFFRNLISDNLSFFILPLIFFLSKH